MKQCDGYRRFLGRLWKHALALGLILVALQSLPDLGRSAETRQITIVHSNNLTGHLFPCPT